MSIFNKTDILKIISEEDKIQAYQDYTKYFDLFIAKIISNIPQEKRMEFLPKQLQEYSLHLTSAFLDDNLDQEMFHVLSKSISRSLMFGDRKISPLMLWEFDRPLLGVAKTAELEDDTNLEGNVKKHRPSLYFS